MPYIDKEASLGQCSLIPVPRLRSRQNLLQVGCLKVSKTTDLDKKLQPRNNPRKTSKLAHTQGWWSTAAYSLIARDS